MIARSVKCRNILRSAWVLRILSLGPSHVAPAEYSEIPVAKKSKNSAETSSPSERTTLMSVFVRAGRLVVGDLIDIGVILMSLSEAAT